MIYNFNFALGSVFFMGLTVLFYMRQKRIRDFQDYLYSVMLLCGLTTVFLDFLTAAVETYDLSIPVTVIYLLNVLLIFSEQLCLPAFFLYTLALSGLKKRRPLIHITASVPYIFVMLLTIASPFCKYGIFFIDSNNSYHTGYTHIALYITTALYAVSSAVVLIANRKNISLSRRMTTYFFFGVIFLAIIPQMLLPGYLTVTSAIALALTAMYYEMRSPGEQVDPFTGAYSRSVLPMFLQNRHISKKAYTLIVVSVSEYDETLRTRGVQTADDLLAVLSVELRRAFPSYHSFFMDTSEFVLIRDGLLTVGEASEIRKKMPKTLFVAGSEVSVDLRLAAIPHNDAMTVEEVLMSTDYLYRMLRSENNDEFFIADAEFMKKCNKIMRAEASIERITSEYVPELVCTPVKYIDGSTACTDITISVNDSVLDGVSTDEIIFMLGRTGYSDRLYEHLFCSAAAAGIGSQICVPLITAIFMQENAAERLYSLTESVGLSPKSILFRMYEHDVVSTADVVSDNIRTLAAMGFSFRLDRFAEGYTDMSILTGLPISSVKIDSRLLGNAKVNRRTKKLLVCIVDIMRGIGKRVHCDSEDIQLFADCNDRILQ